MAVLSVGRSACLGRRAPAAGCAGRSLVAYPGPSPGNRGSGRPTLLLADHPVTGGYPVIAVVVDDDVDAAAQVRPGQQVRVSLVARPDPRLPGDGPG
jgi:hypothetical protein